MDSLTVALLALTLCIPISSVHGYEGCTVRFGRRGCSHRMLKGVLVTCDGLGKEAEVPQNVPSDTVYLSLSNFALTDLNKEDFDMFKKVECLSIVNSGVSSIEEDTFAGMPALQELSLQHTNIHSDSLKFVNHQNLTVNLLTISHSPNLHSINIQPTKNLLHMKTLNLNGNNIHHFRRDMFQELSNLERLDLSDNKIKTLDWRWINELNKLNQLYLAGNRLQTIPQSMYGVFFAVKELTLAGNHLHCNCKLRWLKEFYQLAADKTLDVDEVMCKSPMKIHIAELDQFDFQCSAPTTPEVKYVQLGHDRYEINCTSVGDPAPQLTLTLPDSRKVVTPPWEDLSKDQAITPQIVTAPGNVLCQAENSEGFSESTEGLPQVLALSGTTHLQLPIWTILIATALLVLLQMQRT